MTRTMTATTSRRIVLSRLVAAVAMAPVLGVTLTGTVEARKKGKNTIASIKDRVKWQQELCNNDGGTLDARELPSGTTIGYCEGGSTDGTRCKHTEQDTTCTCTHTGKDGWCSSASTEPGQPGVADPPSGGTLEDPTGSQAGGTTGSSGSEADSGRRSARRANRKRRG